MSEQPSSATEPDQESVPPDSFIEATDLADQPDEPADQSPYADEDDDEVSA